MIESLEISRAEIVTFARCNRKGYLSYFVKGNGVTSRYTNLDIILGIAFHKGFQVLLETKGELELAVEASNAEYDVQLSTDAGPILQPRCQAKGKRKFEPKSEKKAKQVRNNGETQGNASGEKRTLSWPTSAITTIARGCCDARIAQGALHNPACAWLFKRVWATWASVSNPTRVVTKPACAGVVVPRGCPKGPHPWSSAWDWLRV